MKKKVNTGNFCFKEDECVYDNPLNKGSNYFNVNKIKELYNTENNNIYEQIFDVYYEKRNVLKKRKKEKIYRKNSLSPSLNNDDKTSKIEFHVHDKSVTPSLSLRSPLRTPYYQNFKNNNENKNLSYLSLNKKMKSNEEFSFYDNYMDKTPKKLIKDNINEQEKYLIKGNNENHNLNKKSKNTLVNRNSLNKYDFIRFVCSPNKQTSNEKIINTTNAVLSPIKTISKKKENFNKNIYEDTFFSNNSKHYLDKQKSINKNINKRSSETNNDKEISEKKEDKNIEVKGKPQNFIEPYNSYSINRLSKNFFINNKKIFIDDFHKDKINAINYDNDLFIKNMVNEKDNYASYDKKENIHKKKNIDYQNTKDNNIHNYFKKFDDNTYYYDKENENKNDNDTIDNNIYNKQENNENNYIKDMNTYLKQNYKLWKSLYSYLDVSYNCTKEEIKKSYKEKIKIHHPDKGGSIKEFLELKLSYDILINDKKRKMYDKYGNSILELLISEKFNDYNISSDEKNEDVIDDECLRIYDLFVLKYKNISYLHNLYDLKISGNQYNEFQKLIYHFFNMEHNIFKNIFYIYPVFSPHISPFSKNKKKKNSENSIIYFDEISSENSHNTTSDNSPLSFKSKSEITTFDTKKKKIITSVFNDLNSEFDDFYKNYIVEKIELSESNKKKCSKSNENYEKEHKTSFKENHDSFFEKDRFKLSCNDPSYNRQDKAKENENFHENNSSGFFKDIQLSPLAYRIINDDNKKHVDGFYKWFEFFFQDNLSDAERKEDETTDGYEEDLFKNEINKNIHKESESKKGSNLNETVQPIKKKEKDKNLIKQEFINNVVETLNSQDEVEKKIEERFKVKDTFIKNIEENLKNNNEEVTKIKEFFNKEKENHNAENMIQFEEKECHKNLSNAKDYNENTYNISDIDLNIKLNEKNTYNSFNNHNKNTVINNYDSPINRSTSKLSQFHNPTYNSLNQNCEINIDSQNEFTGKKFNKSYDDILNIEEKYGFNLIKKSEHKINDLTDDFNYIYIGNDINKKKNFILFIKEESVKKFLKIKLLINKIKKKSNLKHISLFENEIDKNIKNLEYILLLITYKEELVPLNDFYLLDKNIYSEDYYCIPLYIKKNNIVRPHFIHFKWIVYTLQSLIIFNLYFKKANKYICAFPFFNYKYSYFKKYLEKNGEHKNCDKLKDKYIFFQHYIVKNKHKYLKYFPHYILLSLKDTVSINENSQKKLQINLSPVFVLTPNKIFRNMNF